MEQKLPSIQTSLKYPLVFVAILWVIHITSYLTHTSFARFGLEPRDISGLKGIVTSPLIHGDFNHLISNSIPLLVLMTMLFLFYRKVALPSFITIYILTGIAVWIFAKDAFHIGASGVVYGLVAFVFWSGIFRRNVISIVLSLIVTILYSGLFLGIFPTQDGVSWESHLFGALAGIVTAYIFRRSINKVAEAEETMEDEIEQFYFDRDVFDNV